MLGVNELLLIKGFCGLLFRDLQRSYLMDSGRISSSALHWSKPSSISVRERTSRMVFISKVCHVLYD